MFNGTMKIRTNAEGTAFSLKMIVNLFNTTQALVKVHVLDPHSPVTLQMNYSLAQDVVN